MRTFITMLAALGAVLTVSACQKPAAGAVTTEDMTMGNPVAKVTMIEYASVACPHCAVFNNEVFPAFKAKYIDTGKVHYIAREFLTGDPAIAAAGFLTARCAGKAKYFQVVDAVYRGQRAMMSPGGEPHAALLDIARSAGLSDAQFEACIKDENALSALTERVKKYSEEDKINSTPTFVINGKVYDKGEMSLGELDAAVALAEAGGKAAS